MVKPYWPYERQNRIKHIGRIVGPTDPDFDDGKIHTSPSEV